MLRKSMLVLSIFSFIALVGCAGVTEFDTYIIDRYKDIFERNYSCIKNADYPVVFSCAKRQLADIESTPDSYLKPASVKYAKSFLKLVTESKTMSGDQITAEMKYIVKVRDEDLLFAAKAERSRRDSDFMRRLGNAGTAYNESMRQSQPQSPTRCNSQPDGMGGFTTVCR